MAPFRTGSLRMALALLQPLFLACMGSAAVHQSGSEGSEGSGPFPRPFQIIAHRGASAYAPENTIPAYQRAAELGAVEVELDVQLTRDDEVVLFHDSTLDAKTDRSGRIRDHSLEAVRGADIGTWFDETHPGLDRKFAGKGLDTLSELFEAMGDRLFYHVELKAGEPDLPQRTLDVVDRFALRERVLFSSFRFEQLERIRALAPDRPTCLLIKRSAELGEGETLLGWIERAAAAGHTEVGLPVQELGAVHVARARELGLLIRAWGIKSDRDMEHAIRIGSNGMTTNWPDVLLRRYLEAQGSPGSLPAR